jgi:hypothetical protein
VAPSSARRVRSWPAPAGHQAREVDRHDSTRPRASTSSSSLLALGFAARHVVRRQDARVHAAADVCQRAVGRGERLFEHTHGLACGHERPVGARHFEAQVQTRGGQVGSGGRGFSAGGTFERVGAAGGVDGPHELHTRAEVVGDVGIDDAQLPVGLRHAELVHVVRARVAGTRGERRVVRPAAHFDVRLSRLLPGVLRQAVAAFHRLRDNFVEVTRSVAGWALA